MVAVVDVLQELGGVATRAALISACDRASVDRALTAGDIAAGRGRYWLPSADEAVIEAHRVGGVSSHRSAALRHGWELLVVPDRPEITVPKHRRLTQAHRAGVELHWSDLTSDDVADGTTTADRTLVDCLRSLPFREALAVADSALRHDVSQNRLSALAGGIQGPGARQARRVAALATPLAHNPFESGLRAVAVDVPGLAVEPQVPIYDPGFLGRPDLVDRRLRIVLEADSFAWHGKRARLARDCRRYNALVAHGWLVLRFSWEDVMFHPDQVRADLEAAVGLRTNLLCPACTAS